MINSQSPSSFVLPLGSGDMFPTPTRLDRGLGWPVATVEG
ncbi:hypothetical protein [Alloactinosynnema sp. L-07]|nr:hypothetical protein [Alloactinosynnema sp. L-07]